MPSRQFRSLGLGRQGLGSHLCGRISVTGCISDHIRLYDGLYQKHRGEGQCAGYGLLLSRSQKCGTLTACGGRAVRSTSFRSKTVKDLTPESGVGMEKVTHCDNEGPLGVDGGGISL